MMKILKTVLPGFLLAMCAGCTASGQKDSDNDPVETEEPAMVEEVQLEDLQGTWYDINGNTYITIAGAEMTVTFLQYETVYPVRIVQEGNYFFLDQENGSGFDLMTRLQIMDKELRGGEMVLDADGHKYRFVRQEDKQDALRPTDDSTDMPKEILSDDLVYFALYFSLGEGENFGMQDPGKDIFLESGRYTAEISKEDDGIYWLSWSGMGDSYVILQENTVVSEAFVQGLQGVIRELDLAQYNGYYLHNEKDIQGYSLYAEYDSGEELLIRAEGDPGLTCVFDMVPLVKYIMEAER